MSVEPTSLILASGSPRRRELLGYFGVPFQVLATDAEEQHHLPPATVLAALPPLHLPLRWHPAMLAWRKANAVSSVHPQQAVIGADTIVVLDGDVLNKPTGPDEARQMLRRLSGRSHTVYTGMCLIHPTDDRQRAEDGGRGTAAAHDSAPIRWSFVAGHSSIRFDLVASEVQIAELSDDVIAGYVATGEPLDKAGAYGIQGLGGRLVQQVAGSYTNVVGLPVVATHHLLTSAGFTGLPTPADVYQHWLQALGKEPLPCPSTSP